MEFVNILGLCMLTISLKLIKVNSGATFKRLFSSNLSRRLSKARYSHRIRHTVIVHISASTAEIIMQTFIRMQHFKKPGYVLYS